jgi:PKD repeat protein
MYLRNRIGLALATCALLVNAACDGPIFKPSSSPSIGLTTSTLNPQRVGAAVTFTFTASIPGNAANIVMKNTRIDFGDGESASLGPANAGSVSHAYRWPGTFTAVATATDSLDHSSKARLDVVIESAAPTLPSVGLFSDATNPAPVGSVITFTVSASVPGASKDDPAIKSIHMDFGDGQVVELGATAPAGGVTHTYSAAGTYTVSVTATTTDGATGRASVTVIVNGQGKTFTPSVGLTPSTSSTTLGSVITFTVAASIPNAPAGLAIQNIHLDFGDGSSLDLGAAPPLAGVPHTYSAVGTYTAVATVTDTTGKSASASATVTVK